MLKKHGKVLIDEIKEKLEFNDTDIGKVINLIEKDENVKETINIKDDKQVSKIFEKNVIASFPSSRNEIPIWFNTNSISIDDSSYSNERFSHQLKNSIIVNHSEELNDVWLKDVIIDSRADVFISEEGKPTANDIELQQLFRKTKNNIELLLSKILKSNNVSIHTNHRNSNSRFSIIRDNTSLPGIKSLSLGEAVLFNLFTTIIRYADTNNINSSVTLSNISGIVVIDEIDMHLDSDMQYDVLPELIKLFPKIQFIITTHSPLFLLGMDNNYEREYDLLELPNGNKITTERFSEFLNSYNYMSKTKEFEITIAKRVQELSKNNNKPLVVVEDEHLEIYKVAYLKLKDIKFDKDTLNEMFESNCPFSIDFEEGAGGVAGLINCSNLRVFNKPIIGLFDFDYQGVEKYNGIKLFKEFHEEDYSKGLYKKRTDYDCYALLLPVPERLKRLAPGIKDTNITNNYLEIENYLPEDYVKTSKYFEKKIVVDSEIYSCKDDRKSKLWKELCNLDKSYFSDFEPLFDRIEQLFKIEK